MPEQVYKCHYCNFFSYDVQIVIEHEKICKYNPSNKKCATCRSYTNIGKPAGEVYWVCKKQKHLFKLKANAVEILYGDDECPLWVKSKYIEVE